MLGNAWISCLENSFPGTVFSRFFLVFSFLWFHFPSDFRLSWSGAVRIGLPCARDLGGWF